MEELNTAKTVSTIVGNGMDTLTVIDMGEVVSLAQVTPEGDLNDLIISLDQAEQLMKVLGSILG